MDYPGSSPNRQGSSEPLGQRSLRDLMEQFSERIFVHGERRAGNPAVKAPKEIYYHFDKTRVQRIVDRTDRDENTTITDAYAIFESEGEAAEYDPRERQDPAIIIAIDKQLLSSPANNPIFQNTWYTLTSNEQGDISAYYGYEFVQNGRPLLELPPDVSPEERISFAGKQYEERNRALFRDDEVLLRTLLDTIGH